MKGGVGMFEYVPCSVNDDPPKSTRVRDTCRLQSQPRFPSPEFVSALEGHLVENPGRGHFPRGSRIENVDRSSILDTKDLNSLGITLVKADRM